MPSSFVPLPWAVIPPSHLFGISRNQAEPARMKNFQNSRHIREGISNLTHTRGGMRRNDVGMEILYILLDMQFGGVLNYVRTHSRANRDVPTAFERQSEDSDDIWLAFQLNSFNIEIDSGVKRNSPLAKFSTIGLSAHASSKFMTLTLSLTLIYDPNPNPNPCEILDVEILDACADSPIVENFASGEFRATPAAIEMHSRCITYSLHRHSRARPLCAYFHTFSMLRTRLLVFEFHAFQTSVIRLVDRLTWFYRFGITLQINLSPKVCDLSVMFWINIYKLGLKKYPLKSRNFGNLVCLYLGYHGNYTRFICF